MASGEGLGRRRRGFEGHRGQGAYNIPAVVSKNESESVRDPTPAEATTPANAPASGAPGLCRRRGRVAGRGSEISRRSHG